MPKKETLVKKYIWWGALNLTSYIGKQEGKCVYAK